MEFIIVVLFLTAFGLVCCGIYLFLEVSQFFVQATNLYKDMIARQDNMPKVLHDIRDIHMGNEPDLAHDIMASHLRNRGHYISQSEDQVQFAGKGEITRGKDSEERLDSGICPACGVRTSRALKECSSCMADFSVFDPAKNSLLL